MAAGTYAGGWRIIATLGQRIAKIDPPQGFAAQTACASILWTTAHFGYPVSTTHTISGSVLGAGTIRGFSAVRWGVAGNILVAWILTIPAAALVGSVMELVTRVPGGHIIVFVLAILIAATAFLARRRETRRLAPRRPLDARADPRLIRPSGEVDPVVPEVLEARRAVGVEERLHRLAHRRALVHPDLGVDDQVEPLELARAERRVRARVLATAVAPVVVRVGAEVRRVVPGGAHHVRRAVDGLD